MELSPEKAPSMSKYDVVREEEQTKQLSTASISKDPTLYNDSGVNLYFDTQSKNGNVVPIKSSHQVTLYNNSRPEMNYQQVVSE